MMPTMTPGLLRAARGNPLVHVPEVRPRRPTRLVVILEVVGSANRYERHKDPLSSHLRAATGIKLVAATERLTQVR